MVEVVDSAHQELIAQACAALPGGDVVDLDLLRQYYRHIDLDAVVGRDPADLTAAALAHRALAQRRTRGESLVRAFRPTLERDGFSVPGTLVQVVTDDMPYLVASVTNELERRGALVRLVLHPEPLVSRDVNGDLLEIIDERDGHHHEGFGRIRESWMSFEIEGECDPSRCEELATAVRLVLEDIELALGDWPAIEDLVRDLSRDLASQHSTGSPVSYAENAVAVEFLAWLADNHFAFVGAREYRVEGQARIPLRETDLGMCRSQRHGGAVQPMSMAADPHQLLVVMKSSERSMVYRTSFLDEITVRHFGPDGEVDRETVIFGLFTEAARTAPVTEVPLIREKVAEVVRRSGFTPESHGGQEVLGLLSTYPFDELMQDDVEHLTQVVLDAIHLGNRHTTRVFLRFSPAHDFVSVLIFLPRDRYVTPVRKRLEALLRRTFDADRLEFTARVSEDPRARLAYVLRRADGSTIAPLSAREVDELEAEIAASVRTWQQRLVERTVTAFGEERARAIIRDFGNGFPIEYAEHFTTTQGTADLKHLARLSAEHPTELVLYRPPEDTQEARRFKLFSHVPVSLATVLPIFTNLGVEVTDERPYTITRADGTPLWIYDLGLRVPDVSVWTRADHEDMRAIFEDAVGAIWRGDAESDALNSLVLDVGLTWRQVVILRTLTAYLRQALTTYSVTYIRNALLANQRLAADLVHLFEVRFDPARREPDGTPKSGAQAEEDQLVEAITTALDEVRSLDHDRILRALLAVVQSTLRTTYFQDRADGRPRTDVAIKLEPGRVPGVPQPHPAFEIWVYSPRVEGSHLRFGHVARGGLRWSDRREDFRTEVLGLVKAQMAKNAVIVPTGSKGAFFPKRLPSATDRDAWLAEGVAAYEIFVSALLDLTDNRRGGQVEPPRDVVRFDGDDPYLVVAADKGTARLSDTANRLSREHGFWLDDAFASGGSAGYDHKAMGITARGAWESVKRHFRELGVDTQAEDFTVVGIGDMSGDVFGNGMLLSEHIRLVAAFDHRHVFIDPDPSAATSFQERSRLFDLPRSSWDDYDRALISEGGGVFARTLKSVPITAQMRRALSLADEVEALSPAELISAILRAEVDLLWNGGIGTYVKASTETHAEVGDKTNDGVRVDAADLRVRVIGEGGNLGLTQRGRVEAAAHGVHLNTDAIDNSAGVDTSDHEVNIKILLSGLIQDGTLTMAERDTILQDMTGDVADHVLRTNYDQNVLLGTTMSSEHQIGSVLPRALAWLEQNAHLDRDLEFLPSDAELARRGQTSTAMYQPENAVAAAYAKLAAKREILASDLPDDPWFGATLAGYFPFHLRHRFGDEIQRHPLRREIIANAVANGMINQGGFTFVFRAAEETGATTAQVARAYVAAREVFALDGFADQIERLDNRVPAEVQYRMYLASRRLLDRGTRWFLASRPAQLDLAAEVARFSVAVAQHESSLVQLLAGGERERLQAEAAEYEAAGVPADLAMRAAGLLDLYAFLDIVDIAMDLGRSTSDVAPLYFLLSEEFGVDELLRQVSALPRVDRWETLARGALREDLYTVLESLTRAVLASSATGSPQERIAQWERDYVEWVQRARTTLGGMDLSGEANIAALSVALRSLRSMVR